MSQSELFNMINEISFSMDDTRLFLDTHPECESALNYFKRLHSKRHDLIHKYTMEYGPLTQYSVDEDCNNWTWNQAPLPWEFGGCR